jgi:hypothetical protein
LQEASAKAVCGVDFMFEIERGINGDMPERIDAPRDNLIA